MHTSPLRLYFVGLLLVSLLSAPTAYALDIKDIQIQPAEVAPHCRAVKGTHAVSVQAEIQYQMTMSGSAASVIYGEPEAKSYQSFQCGRDKGTIYYYQFESAEAIEKIRKPIAAVLWGEEGPTEAHPEQLLVLDNILVVVSSPIPIFFSNLLSHREHFPDLSDAIIDGRLNTLQCLTDDTVGACNAVQRFKSGSIPFSLLEQQSLLVGLSWDVSNTGVVGHPNFEVLYVSKATGGQTVAAFGGLVPEDAQELQMIKDQIVAQANGSVSPSAQPLLSYIRQTQGRENAKAQLLNDRSLAFIGMGNRVYLRQNGNEVILLTNFLNETPLQPYVISVFRVAGAK